LGLVLPTSWTFDLSAMSWRSTTPELLLLCLFVANVCFEFEKFVDDEKPVLVRPSVELVFGMRKSD